MSGARLVWAIVFAVGIWCCAKSVEAHPIGGMVGEQALIFGQPDDPSIGQATRVRVEFRRFPDPAVDGWPPPLIPWEPLSEVDAPWLMWDRCWEIPIAVNTGGKIRIRLEGPFGISTPSNEMTVPEPASAVLIGIGAASLAALARRRRPIR